ncbi:MULTISPECIES: hypothetical protein [unclassified Streptomyces]|uniref:hypothetical protein n=1 Tax=unclassified Streptomyces TaxID=2593676 RepID=UPI00224FB705|nr:MULTISPECIES: hypothetical protein [unclassified Streptomyces]MCX4549635.1 hypothetical protein [Streptomyces sp. NBC_01500]WSC21164.1 hypothetical protein OIE60_16560 [Streptomyces sp. NBC_01766]
MATRELQEVLVRNAETPSNGTGFQRRVYREASNYFVPLDLTQCVSGTSQGALNGFFVYTLLPRGTERRSF